MEEIIHLQDGTLLQGGKYKIVRFIGSGGFGCTYEAEHVLLRKHLAIKEFFVKDFCNRDQYSSHVFVGTQSKMPLMGKLRNKFINEARALCNLQHPGIVKVSDVFEENGTAYYVMDYIEGSSLQEMVKSRGRLPEQLALKYISQVAAALKYVHAHGRLHLDIKPGNIMVDRNGNAILIDFGASKQYDEENGETTSTIIGQTPGYAPPEQLGNEKGTKFFPPTDIYALGATLYNLLTGKTPIESALLIAGEELEPLPAGISRSTREAVLAAMQLNKNNRPQSVDEFLQLLKVSRPSQSQSTGRQQSDDTVYTSGRNDSETKLDPTVLDEDRRVSPDDPPVRTVDENKDAPKKKSKYGAAIFLISAIVACVIVLVFVFGGKDDKGQGGIGGKNEDIVDFTGTGKYPMVYVEGGTFEMGASVPEEDDCPPHTVKVGGFWIGLFEVDQGFFEDIMGYNPSMYQPADYYNYPVENVPFDEVDDFIERLNGMTGRRFALPTEAQWEYAAKGGNSSRHFIYSGTNNPNKVWFNREYPVQTRQEYSVNELGIYQMSGNVYELCRDYYDRNFYLAGGSVDPVNLTPGRNKLRVVRGGSFYSDETREVSLYYREAANMESDDVGFRLVVEDDGF